MKFAFVTQSYPPDSCGVSHVVQSICEKLVTYGHEVIVFTEWNERSRLEINGVLIREYKIKGNYVEGYSGETERFKCELRNSECDVLVIECAQTWTLDLSLEEIPKKQCLKIFHSHDFSWFKRRSRNPIKNVKWAYYFWSLRNRFDEFDIIYCLSETLPDFNFIKKFHKKTLKVLPNGVDDIYINDPLVTEGSVGYLPPTAKPYIVCLANYNILKNQKDVLDAYIKTSLNFDLVFVGSSINDYSRFLESYAKAAGVADRVYFLSGLSKHEISIILRSAHLFAYASLWEAFPLVICETIASGTPWVSYNVGCVRDLPGGVALSQNNPKTLAREISLLLNDPNRLADLRERCFAERKKFDNSHIVASFLDDVKRLSRLGSAHINEEDGTEQNPHGPRAR